MKSAVFLFLFSTLSFAGSWRNYTDPNSPIYQHEFSESSSVKETYKVVTMNLHWSHAIPKLIEAIRNRPELRDADAYLLQEVVGEPGSETQHSSFELAKALKLNYVYVPAFIHKQNEKDFGVAILSPHPMSDLTKLILPHPHFLDKTQRVAVGATVETPMGPVRTYSIHAETLQLYIWRHHQVDEVFQDAKDFDSLPLVLGGDFNTAPVWQKWSLFRFAGNRGWEIPTRKVKGASFVGVGGIIRFRLDHIFSKNIRAEKSGKVRIPAISNHDFLWTIFKLH